MRPLTTHFRQVLAGVSVLLPRGAGPALLPEECACCGEPATHRHALPRKDGVSVLVGYCDECAEHQAGASSRVLALALASLILALVGAAGLPLLAPRLGLLALALSVCALSLLPFAGLLLAPRPAAAPHSARGAAVHWVGPDRLWCAAPRYAERLAELNAGEQHAEPLRERLASAWLSAGPVIGIGAACLSFFLYHPLLRIINLGTVRIEVAIDGERLVAVDPTSNESPAAGALLRVPAGEHSLSVSSTVDGAALGQVQASFHSGSVHLFAFGADDVCFWLETTGYGQEQLAGRSYAPLQSAEHFWVLPGGIDTWFAPNPSSSDPSSHSSGGLLTALRQAPC
ncbi:MAG TPA: hypothetical protein VHW01_07760, partial [Polyangiaceae bacterium]|nr:hypothetical protein [Polyangiaceae bacterium]